MNENLPPRVVRIGIAELVIFDVSESELEQIERGGTDSLILNFAIFCFSTAVSTNVTMATVIFPAEKMWIFALLASVVAVCYLGSVVLIGVWLKMSKLRRNTISAIRGRRIPADPGDPA